MARALYAITLLMLLAAAAIITPVCCRCYFADAGAPLRYIFATLRMLSLTETAMPCLYADGAMLLPCRYAALLLRHCR